VIQGLLLWAGLSFKIVGLNVGSVLGWWAGVFGGGLLELDLVGDVV
jgi:hypothetical protein